MSHSPAETLQFLNVYADNYYATRLPTNFTRTLDTVGKTDARWLGFIEYRKGTSGTDLILYLPTPTPQTPATMIEVEACEVILGEINADTAPLPRFVLFQQPTPVFDVARFRQQANTYITERNLTNAKLIWECEFPSIDSSLL